jgi:hypothetical protein
LTKAVLTRRKTQTRRVITCPKTFKGQYVAGFNVYKRVSDGFISEICMYDADERAFEGGQIVSKYKLGEVIAVSQNMCDVYAEWDAKYLGKDTKALMEKFGGSPCFKNKMFVKASEMPHQIRITKVRIEHLQDISDNDCLAEGIEFDGKAQSFYCGMNISTNAKNWLGCTPREAYAALIDKINGKGTWESNPYVFVYEFELVK